MSVTAARGFMASGVAAGIKDSGDPDLALVATTDGRAVAAAGVFTANKMTAAPVITSARHLTLTNGKAAAVVLNSGNANAATGAAGLAAAQHTCDAVAAALGCASEEVLVCSTGLIGIPLPVDVLIAALPAAAEALRHGPGGQDAADAILTTDTHRKESAVKIGPAVVGGMAKGAAMLAPNMATMLAVLTTDAAAEPHELQRMLQAAVSTSFNTLVVDGCQSTNDTVLILASGLVGPVPAPDLEAAIGRVCADLALGMAGDAEGATKVVRLTVTGARSDADADRGARQIAGSALCKCSWYGEDPYWGRLASELGSAGIDLDQTTVAISYGGVRVAEKGVAVDHDEAAVRDHMAGRYLEIGADLGLGDGTARIITNDLTHAYVDENMGTS